MSNNRIPKQIMEGSLGGSPAGKPKNRCEYGVWKEATQFMSITGLDRPLGHQEV
jgi:hypothetical protein